MRETEQGVRGAAQVVGDRVPRQETRLRTTRRGTLLHRTLDDVIDIRGEEGSGKHSLRLIAFDYVMDEKYF